MYYHTFSYSDDQVTVMLAISAFTMQPDQHQRLKKVFWNGVDYVLRAITVQLGLRMKYLALRGHTGKFTEHGEMICQTIIIVTDVRPKESDLYRSEPN